MKKEEIAEECKVILKKYASDKNKVDEIKEVDEVAETLGLDSLDLVEVVMELEEKFNVSIAEEDIAKIKTFHDMVSYIENALKQA